MHELPVTESILSIALKHAESAGAKRVTEIYLVIGELASIIDESVSFYWDIVSKDTLAEGANLIFRRIKAELLCRECDQRYQPDGRDFNCPTCDGHKVKVIAGDEFSVEAIQVED
jgi:hydrogenase nickel incorporation protein HypA/HybF